MSHGNPITGQDNKKNQMETSLFLAKVMGLFGAISTLAIIIRYKLYVEMEVDAVKNPTTIYFSGFLFIILGVLVTVSHQVWTRDWRVVITVLGWMILAKGVIRIFLPDTVKKLIEKKKSDRRFFLAEVVGFFISLYLLYKGFILN